MPEEVWLAAFQREIWLEHCAQRIETRRQRELLGDLIFSIVLISLLVGLSVWLVPRSPNPWDFGFTAGGVADTAGTLPAVVHNAKILAQVPAQ